MNPILFYLGNNAVSSYFTFITLGIFAGLFVFYLGIKRSKLDPAIAIDIGLLTSITGYVGGRLFHILFEMPSFYFNNPLEIFAFWKGGYVYYGSILFPLIFIYFYCRIKNLKMIIITDLMAPGVALGSVFGRIGCFLQGCCYGKVTNLPWGISFPFDTPDPTPKGIPLHPTQLYLVLVNTIIFITLIILGRKKRSDGVLTYTYLISYGFGLSFVEMFREDFRGDLFSPYLSTSQFISLVVILYSTFKLIKNYRKTKLLLVLAFLFSSSASASNYSKIISLSPAISETLIQLGLGDKIVCAASPFSDKIKKLKNVTDVGPYFKPNLEKIISCKADLIITTYSGTPPDIHEKLSKMNYKLLFDKPESIESIKNFVKTLGEIFNINTQKTLSKFDEQCSSVSPNKPAIFLIGFNPIFAAGKDSYISSAMSCAGFKNIIEGNYPRINVEKIIKLNPQYILIASDYGFDSKDYKILEETFKNRIFKFKTETLLQPSVSILEGIKELKLVK